MKLQEVMAELSSYELSYHNLSIVDTIGDGEIEYTVKNILSDYINDLKQNSVTVKLNNEEFSKFIYNPRLLSHILYGTTELYYLILLLNNITSEKDFDFRYVTILRPDSLDLLNRILNTESKHIHIANSIDDELVEKGSTFNRGGMFEGNKSDEINNEIMELRYQIEQIKSTILDSIDDLIDDNLNAIIADNVKSEIDKINKNLEELVITTVDTILKSKDFSDRVINLESKVTTMQNLIDTIIKNDYSTKIDTINETLSETVNKVNLLEKSMEDIVSINVREQLEKMGDEITKFKNDINTLIENNNQKILDKMAEDIEALKSKLGTLLVGTKDVVLQLPAPLKLGIQQDSEFFIPYTGKIEQFIVAVNSGTILSSNLLIGIQYLDKTTGKWADLHTIEMYVTDSYKIVTFEKEISPMYVRIALIEGDYFRVDSLTTIIRVREGNGGE